MLKKRILNFIFGFYLKVRLPFFKTILIGTHRSWLELDFQRFTVSAFLKGVQPIFLMQNLKEKEIDFSSEEKIIRGTSYEEISLFEVTQYQICVELQIFITDIDFQNPKHIDIIQKWFRRAAAFIDTILFYFKKYKFCKALILQGYLYESAIIRWICIKNGIDVIAVENTFNKNKIVWDNISCITVNRNLAENYFWRYSASPVLNPKDCINYSNKFLQTIKTNKQHEHISPDQKITFNPERKIIFFIGQVYTDSSTLFGINDFHSPVSIINHLVEFSIEKGYTLIIKLHPKEKDGFDVYKNRYNSLTHRKVMENDSLYNQIQNAGNIIYDYKNTYDTYSIIKASTICVTINSQAGLEALMFGKRVITCGKAFYKCLKSVHTAENKSDLLYMLDSLMTNDLDNIAMEEVYNFFYIFCEKYCIEKNIESFLKLIFKKSLIR